SSLEMELQVPRGFRSQRATESLVWEGPSSSGDDISRPGTTEGVPDYRGARHAGSCPHVFRDPPEASGGVGHWFSQGQKQYRHRSAVVWQRTKLHGRTLLGSGLCRFNRWIRTRASSPIHPRAAVSGWIGRSILNFSKARFSAATK